MSPSLKHSPALIVQVAGLLALAAMALLTPPASAAPSQVIIVRHAEKAAEPKDDPGLTAEGQARAQQLAELLADAGVTTIVTTHWRRTRDTAAPLAARLGVTPQPIRARLIDGFRHIDQVVEAVRQAQGVVLVVGHSNTVPELVAALSSTAAFKLCETSFSHLFVITPVEASAPAARRAPALHLRYGAADTPPSGDCR